MWTVLATILLVMYYQDRNGDLLKNHFSYRAFFIVNQYRLQSANSYLSSEVALQGIRASQSLSSQAKHWQKPNKWL
ncbi:MAG TPA: hypothetical protein VEI46_02185 [Thermodesulfovibrionales bacterium]|nr:hypothetical protein [Thermodesulfovibrionales bacterium]